MKSKNKSLIIGIVAIKGGVGKSQISFQLSARFSQEERKVLLIDSDRQETSFAYTEFRKETDEPQFASNRLFDLEIRKKVLEIKQEYDIIIIDVGASDSESLRAAISVCDLVLSPVVPASESLWSMENKLLPIISEMKEVNPKLRVYSFLNQSPPQGSDEDTAADYLKNIKGIDYIDTPVKFRTAFKNSVTLGKCINEMKGKYRDKKAIYEFESLFNNTKKVLKLNQ